MTENVTYNNIIKLPLKELDKSVFYSMSDKFNLFSSIIKGDILLYLKLNTFFNKKDFKLKDLKNNICAFAAVEQNYLYNTLDSIEVLPENRNHGLSKQLLDTIFYDCSKEQKNLCITKLSSNGKKHLINNIEFFSSKYGIKVYTLDEMKELLGETA